MAIKESLEVGSRGLRVGHLMQACVDEFKENEDLPNTTNPDDWARISGKKGERIVYIRTLISGKGNEAGRAIDTATNTGQDRKSVVEGKSVDLGGRRIIKKNKNLVTTY